jgi:hypothetical protein
MENNVLKNSGIAESLNEIANAMKEFDYCYYEGEKPVTVDSNISIIVDDDNDMYVLLNGVKIIKYATTTYVSKIRKFFRGDNSGENICFVTLDKSVANVEFVKSLAQTLNDKKRDIIAKIHSIHLDHENRRYWKVAYLETDPTAQERFELCKNRGVVTKIEVNVPECPNREDLVEWQYRDLLEYAGECAEIFYEKDKATITVDNLKMVEIKESEEGLRDAAF